jgi:hypothetical protein
MLEREDGLFNALGVRQVEGDELKSILRFLVEEGPCVQRAVPLAQVHGEYVDARVVMIDAAPAFTVFRQSSYPVTNLHLGGRRGDFETCRSAVPNRVWFDALDQCRETARLFRSHMVGIDVLFERGFSNSYILEANAFGDFFPNLRDARGRTVHRAELESLARFWN